jgi:curved DNA-binding protein CbpA
MAKRKNSTEHEPSGHRCYWAGCMEAGDFRAPRSRTHLHEYQWFCENHIKEFNKSWNYFEGMNEDQIYAFQKDATHGHRPTWRMDQLKGKPTARLEEAFGRMFGESPTYKAEVRPIGAREKDALAVLDLEHPSDKASIKSQYRELVKKYHPDVNRGSIKAEETFKKITHAYQHLVTHYMDK